MPTPKGLTAGGGTRVSAETGEAQFSRWGAQRRGEQPVMEPTSRLTRRVREEYRVYSDRNATMSGAQRRGSSRDGSPADAPTGAELGRVGSITGCLAGMDRRSSPHRENWAAWVSPPVVHAASQSVGADPG